MLGRKCAVIAMAGSFLLKVAYGHTQQAALWFSKVGDVAINSNILAVILALCGYVFFGISFSAETCIGYWFSLAYIIHACTHKHTSFLKYVGHFSLDNDGGFASNW